MDRQLHDLLDAAVGEPPHRLSVEAMRRRVARRRLMECSAGAAAVAVIAVIVPAGIVALGRGPGPSAGGQRPVVPTVYVSDGGPGGRTVIPVTITTNTARKPINVGNVVAGIAITPDGKTVYVASEESGTVTPITASNVAGKTIKVGRSPGQIAITPDGKTAYVAAVSGTVTPITTATNTPGKRIKVGYGPAGIAVTP